MSKPALSMTRPNLLAQICLYGIPAAGFGWLAETAERQLLGDGQLRSATREEAIREAALALRASGVREAGVVQIFEPGGETCTLADLPALEALLPGVVLREGEQVPAHLFVISASAIIAAAEQEG